MKLQFTKHFDRYACDGDSISLELGPWPLRFVATISRDTHSEAPDREVDGFWPSLDPKDAGYIGPRSEATLRRRTARAQEVMDAWKRDEWWWVNVDVQAWFGPDDDTPLTEEYAYSCGGCDCNYPDHWWKGKPKGWYPNMHLQEVANEELANCALEAFAKLVEFVRPGDPGYDALVRFDMARIHGVTKPELLKELLHA